MDAVWLLLGGTVAVFAAIVLGLVAAGVMSGQQSGVGRSLQVLEAFTAAPQAIKQEIDPDFKDRVLVPTVRWFARLGRRLTPADHQDRMRQKLDAAGNPSGWTADQLTSMKAVGFVAGLALSLLVVLLVDPPVLLAVVIGVGLSLAGYYAVDFWLYQKAHDRANTMRRELADSIDLLTISVEAGLGFDAALANVAKNTEGPLADEFGRMLQEMQIGKGRGEALRALGERSKLAELRGFATAMIQADAFGIPVGKVLRVQSSEMRTKRRQLAEEKATEGAGEDPAAADLLHPPDAVPHRHGAGGPVDDELVQHGRPVRRAYRGVGPLSSLQVTGR